MKRFLQRVFLGLLVVSAAGCSDTPSFGGLFGSSSDGLSVKQSNAVNPNAPLLKYAASIHVVTYVDDRNMGNPKKIGIGAENISGMTGKDIVLDQDVATLVTRAMKKHLDDAGFQVTEASGNKSIFELSGVVKELTYNVKYRDEVAITVETTLKDSTGKVVWSGVVVEKKTRFAGISGDDKTDVANFLKKELGIVCSKTTEAVSAVLMAAHPELFNLTPGTRPIPGVTVLVAPAAAVPPSAAMPSQQYSTGSAAVPPPALAAHATATTGLLLVNTNPQRAKVYVDDVYYGLSPLRVEMDPGIHNVSVKLEGYQMVAEKVSVRKGDNTDVELNLER